MRFSCIGGGTTIGFAALLVGTDLILAPAGFPLIGAFTSDVTDFVGNHGELVELTSALGPFVWLLAPMFGAATIAVLWQAERRRGERCSLVGLAGLLLQNTTSAGVLTSRLALTGTTADTSATDLTNAHHESTTLPAAA